MALAKAPMETEDRCQLLLDQSDEADDREAGFGFTVPMSGKAGAILAEVSAVASTSGDEDDGLGRPRQFVLVSRLRPRSLVLGAFVAMALVAAVVMATVAVRPRATTIAVAGGEEGQEVVLVDEKKAVSLFCFSVMKPGGSEQELIEFQLKKRASIFACDDFAVICSKKVNLGPGDYGDVHTWYNPTPTVQLGQLGANGVTTNSFLNTQIFVIAWKTLLASKEMEDHDFIVKADPDAVFFPDRLVGHVQQYKGQKVYLPNCNMFLDAPPAGPKLYGALEVFSKQAIDLLLNGGFDRCTNQLNWHGWGEDYFMQSCMMMLGAQGMADYNLVGDHRCIPANCDDYRRVAFHDFKDPKAWDACFKTAIGR